MIPTYPWFDKIPPGLQDIYRTRRQLAADGLRPGGPVVARVVWRRGRCHADLYDVRQAVPKRPATEAQKAALALAQIKRSTCPGCGTVFSFVLPRCFDCPECHDRMMKHDCAKARAWARRMLSDSQSVIMDTETTDLHGYLVQIAVIRLDGSVLLDTLIDPQSAISPDAARIHGLTQERLRGAPTFAEIEPALRTFLFGRRVLVYNAPFDRAILANEMVRQHERRVRRFGISWYDSVGLVLRAWFGRIRFEDVMGPYSTYCGEWSERHCSYRWQRLPGGDHSALGDCRATLRVLQEMAEE